MNSGAADLFEHWKWAKKVSPNSWQMMTVLNPLDARIPKIPFSFFYEDFFWGGGGSAKFHVHRTFARLPVSAARSSLPPGGYIIPLADGRGGGSGKIPPRAHTGAAAATATAATQPQRQRRPSQPTATPAAPPPQEATLHPLRHGAPLQTGSHRGDRPGSSDPP